MTIIKAVLRIHNCGSPKIKDVILAYKIMIFKLVLKNQISSHKTTSSMGGSLMNIIVNFKHNILALVGKSQNHAFIMPSLPPPQCCLGGTNWPLRQI